MRKIDVKPGDRYGRLTIAKEVEKRGLYRFFECLCYCGQCKIIPMYSLRKGSIVSCGCFHDEQNKKPRISQRTENYGLTNTRLYSIWCGMRKRCNNANSHGYMYYGGKGVSVCPEWNRFKAFHDWSMSHGYTDSLTIDRIDVNGNYEPANCRWITIQEQQKNRTR